METFVKTMFYIGIICEIARILTLGVGEYPRQISKLADSISSVINIAFIIWAACLIWK